MKKCLILAVLIISVFFNVSCSKKMIKGTNIEDTQDARDILTVFGHYLKGFKEKDPSIFIPYISKEYYDTNGTDDPADDIDYDKMIEILNSDAYRSLEKVSVTCILKDLEFEENNGNLARLLFFFEVRFKMKTQLPPEENAFIAHDGMLNHKISDNNQMKFIKEDGEWKIVSGL